MRPNRDYTKHLTWTYEMNKNLYDIYNEAKQEGRGYMQRMKDIWDKTYPKHNDLTSKHLREQVMRVINKRLIRETGLVVESDRPTTRNSEQDHESAETSTENIENTEINNTNNDIHIEIQQEGETTPGIETEDYCNLKQLYLKNFNNRKNCKLNERPYSTRIDRGIRNDKIQLINSIITEHLEDIQ